MPGNWIDSVLSVLLIYEGFCELMKRGERFVNKKFVSIDEFRICYLIIFDRFDEYLCFYFEIHQKTTHPQPLLLKREGAENRLGLRF